MYIHTHTHYLLSTYINVPQAILMKLNRLHTDKPARLCIKIRTNGKHQQQHKQISHAYYGFIKLRHDTTTVDQ